MPIKSVNQSTIVIIGSSSSSILIMNMQEMALTRYCCSLLLQTVPSLRSLISYD